MNREILKTDLETAALASLGAAKGFYDYYASPMIQDATKAITAASKMVMQNLIELQKDQGDGTNT